MVEAERIAELAMQIAREHHPERIILFGSYAYGTPTDDSDVDLLVVLPFDGHPARKAGQIRAGIHAPFPLDVLVRTPEQVRQRLAWNDFFMREIVEEGKVLFDAD